MTLSELLERLQQVRPSGEGFTARCPVDHHDDRHSSVSVAESDTSTLLVKCQAGCSTESVVGALGLTLSDLAPADGRQVRRASAQASGNKSKGEGGSPSSGFAVEESNTANAEFTVPEYAHGHLLKASELRLDVGRANRGTTRGREALERSLREYGAGRSVLLDRDGHVIAGNKTVEHARRLGMPVRVVETDGRHLVAVQRRDLDLLTDPKARELAIADNRIGELDLDWDEDALRALHADGIDLSPFWTDEEFDALVGELDMGEERDENAVIEPPTTDIMVGDMFLLGRHRLLCGDATAEKDVERVLGGDVPVLMATDPPYGVEYDPSWRHEVDPRQRTAVGTVRNDDRATWGDAFAFFPGAVAYVWHAGLMAGVVASELEQAGFALRAQIIWQKQHFAMSRGHYHWQHEPAWYAVRTGETAHWAGSRSQTTVWEIPNLNPLGGERAGENAVTGHGTQKPVALWEIPIRNHTVSTDVVYDPFCGSGTAVIAAEKTGRTCFAIDIDPRYIQATITRWERFSGHRAEPLDRPAERSREGDGR